MHKGYFAPSLIMLTTIAALTPSLSARDSIVFCGRMPGDPQNNIYRIDPSGDNLQNITPPIDTEPHYAILSPNGTRIAFLALSGSHKEVWTMQVDGTNPIAHTNNDDQYPDLWCWADDSWLLYRRAPGPSQGDIHALNVDSGQDILVLGAGQVDGQASIDYVAISSDRNTLAILAQAGSWSPTLDIYLADIAVNTVPTVANIRPFYVDADNDHEDFSPTWSTDGTLFWSHRLSSGPGTSDRAVVAKFQYSAEPVYEYDAIVHTPNTSPAVVSPDGQTLLYIDRDSKELMSLDLTTGHDTVFLDVDSVNNRLSWGSIPGGTCRADIDGDGDVDQSDLGLLLAEYGRQDCE